MKSVERRFIGAMVLILFSFGSSVLVHAEPFAAKDERLVETFMSWRGAQDVKVSPEAMKSFLAKVSSVIDSGADVNTPDKFGNRPLLLASYWAAWRSDGENFNDLVALLLARGADPNVGEQGTPMHLAATGTQNVRLIEILCAAGGSTKTQVTYDKKRVTSLEMARDYNTFPGIRSAMEKCALSQ
jgi:ankyrin repeat protein